MRNLKKFLALVLAMMMVFSLMVTVNAATTFDDDADIDPAYAEAAQVLQFIGVYEGSSNKMDPKGDFTRAFLATLGYNVGTGDVDHDQTDLYIGLGKFDDVPENNWANPYINYAYIAEWIHGQSETKYNPSGKVTGYEVLALLLQIMGYGKNGEFIGPNWKIETARYADEAGLTDGLVGVTLSKVATREQVAQMVFNALKPTTDNRNDIVTWDARLTKYVSVVSGENLGWKYFRLDCTPDQDSWGRPLTRWYQDWNENGVYDSATEGSTTIAVPMAIDPYVTAVDECDVYVDLDLARDAVIESCWIDGIEYDPADYATTTDMDAAIKALGVGSIIGAQGRQTELYYMGSTVNGNEIYRLVEINTYLAEVTKVNAAPVDDAGHVGNRTIELNVFVGWCDGTGASDTSGAHDVVLPVTGYVSDAYARGEFVLVTINRPTFAAADNGGADAAHVRAGDINGTTAAARNAVRIVDYAPVIAAGAVTGYADAEYPNPATITVADKDYPEADQFWHNYRQLANWAAYGDLYGNVIGLGISASNYAVIEAMQWIHSGLRQGYAVADLILADGTRVNNVRISTIAGDPANNTGDAAGVPTDSSVSDDWTNNTDYYGHIIRYSVNEADGSYNIDLHDQPATSERYITDSDQTNKATSVFTGTIVQTQATMWDDNGAGANADNLLIDADETVFGVGTDNTVYLVRNVDGTYTIYKGKDNVPTIRKADICVLSDEEGYATLVVVNGDASESVQFVAYVGKTTASASRVISGNTYTVYQVYKLGETGITQILIDTATVTDWTTVVAANGTGLYTFKVGKNNVVAANGDIKALTSNVINDTKPQSTASADGIDTTMNYVNVLAAQAGSGNSLQTKAWSGSDIDSITAGTANINLNLRSDTKIILVTKNGATENDAITQIRGGKVTDIEVDDVLMVAYQEIAGRQYADTIYVIRKAGTVSGNVGSNTTLVSSTYTVYSLTVGGVDETGNGRMYQATGTGTSANALAAAKANAQTISLSEITSYLGTYSISVTVNGGGTTNIRMYSASSVPTSAITIGSSVTSIANASLVAGNYIVVAVGANGAAADAYAVYRITA